MLGKFIRLTKTSHTGNIQEILVIHLKINSGLQIDEQFL